MELYIEKTFIDDLYLTMDFNNPTPSQKILLKIFKEYGEVEKFINVPINTVQELEELKSSNILIANLCEYHPVVSIDSIRDHFFNNSKCEQTIIFIQETEEWFGKAEEKGALCFSLENYETKIENIINQCTVKIDLSEHFNGWSQLDFIKLLPINEIIISDPYILIDSTNQRIDDNIVPFLKILLNDSKSILVKLLTSRFPVRLDTPDNIRQKVISIHTKLNRVFANKPVKFKIASSNKSSGYAFEFHDRIVLSNFYQIECGKGFNLMPFNQNDSVLTSDTIFDKFTYNRHKNLRKKYIGLEKHLEKHDSYYFKYYPD